MSYNTTGKCHFDGIANEKELCERMRNDRSFAEAIIGSSLIGDYTVEHIGGTKHKEDVVLHTPNGSVKISAKFKKDKKKGSFDYLNGSKAYKKYAKGHLAAACGKFRSSPLPVKTVRPFITEACSMDLDEITPTEVRRILETEVAAKYKDLVTVVTDKKANKIYAYNFADSPLGRHLHRQSKITIEPPRRGRGKKSSRQILFDGEDIGLRLRVVTNNGVTALLGRSKSNKTSIPTVKFQQDKVKRVLEGTTNLREASF
jgi:hypothetical protein